MSFRLRSFFLIGLLLIALAVTGLAQTGTPTLPAATPNTPAEATGTPAKTPKPTPTPKASNKITTADQAVENAIFLYGFPGGRVTLNQIRKTTIERGTSRVTAAEGKLENTNYQRFVIRGESLDKEKIRLDQEFPSATYSLIYNDNRIFGIFSNTVFSPREDAVKTFENQMFRSIDALLRYQENGSKIDLAAREKLMGVDYYVIDLTDKEERKTRFYLSAKTFRVMMLTYEDAGVSYRRRFYDYNYAQGTLVPYQTILWADDKVVEDSEVGTITFGQKVDEQLFAAG